MLRKKNIQSRSIHFSSIRYAVYSCHPNVERKTETSIFLDKEKQFWFIRNFSSIPVDSHRLSLILTDAGTYWIKNAGYLHKNILSHKGEEFGMGKRERFLFSFRFSLVVLGFFFVILSSLLVIIKIFSCNIKIWWSKKNVQINYM